MLKAASKNTQNHALKENIANMKKMIFRKCGFEKNIYFRLLKNKKVNIYQIFKKIIDFNKLKKTSEKPYDC